MKTKTFSILFALVMILSLSVGVFADAWDETWDEDTVLTVFSDMDLVFPDLFAPDDSAFLWEEVMSFPSELRKDADGFISKAPVAGQVDYLDQVAPTYPTYPGTFTFDPCGDGLIKYNVTVNRADFIFPGRLGTNSTSVGADKYGPQQVTFIRDIDARVQVNGNWYDADVKKCLNPENCHLLIYNRNGEARLEGFLTVPEVLTANSDIRVSMQVYVSNYKTALWNVPEHYFTVEGVTAGTAGQGTVTANLRQDYCQNSLTEYAVPGTVQDDNLHLVRAKYDENTGEARFQATIRNFAQEPVTAARFRPRTNYVIPADILIPFRNQIDTDLNTCTISYNSPYGFFASGDNALAFYRANWGADACTEKTDANGYTFYDCQILDAASGDVSETAGPIYTNIQNVLADRIPFIREQYEFGDTIVDCQVQTFRCTVPYTGAYGQYTTGEDAIAFYKQQWGEDACNETHIDDKGYQYTTCTSAAGEVADRIYTTMDGLATVQADELTASYQASCTATNNFFQSADMRDTVDRFTDYTCKYTIYNNANGAPRTDFCKFGEGIALAPNAIIRFDITIDHLSGDVLRRYPDGSDIPFMFRVGGMTNFVGRYIDTRTNIRTFARFEAVDFPCPYLSRMQVRNPLLPFATFYRMDPDPAIKPSGPYGVYEGGLWGMYQKCGKYAYMAVRLFNDGTRPEVIDLSHTPVAINGGTPISWNWVLSSVDAWKGKIVLEGGDQVILIGRAKVTDIPAQLNADTAMTGAINFTDFGFYITGKVFSDHNNTNCVLPPQ